MLTKSMPVTRPKDADPTISDHEIREQRLAHQCEGWQMQESARGGRYCAGCGAYEGRHAKHVRDTGWTMTGSPPANYVGSHRLHPGCEEVGAHV